jgi:hypothetical protein
MSTAMETAARAQDMAQSLGASTQTIQTLSYAAGVSEANLDSMTGALQKLEKSAVAAASGSQQDIEAFRAIGISATQAAQLMRDPDKLIQTVTAHMAQFADGSGKTAVAMQLMGRSAAENIPLINKLGTEYDDLAKKAKNVGVAMDDSQTRALAAASEKYNEIGQDVKGLTNLLAVELLPTLDDVADRFNEWLQSDAAKRGVSILASSIRELYSVAVDLSGIAAQLPGQIRDDAAAFNDWAKDITGTSNALREFLDLLPKVKKDSSGGLLQFPGADSTGFFGAQAVHSFLQSLDQPSLGSDLAEKMEQSLTKPIQDFDNTLKIAVADVSTAGAGLDLYAQHVEKAGKAQINYNANVAAGARAAQEAARAVRELDAAHDAALSMVDKLRGELGGPAEKALSDYKVGMRDLQNQMEKWAIAGGNVDEIIQLWQEGETLLGEKLAITNEQIAAQNDLLKQSSDQFLIEAQVLQQIPSHQDAVRAGLETYNRLLVEHKDFTGRAIESDDELRETLDRQLPSFIKNKQAVNDLDEAYKNSQQVLEDWRNIYQQGLSSIASAVGNFFTGQIRSWSDFGKELIGGVKQMIAQIIEEFLKLQFINPILNSIFGGSLGLLPTMASAAGFGGGSGGSGLVGGIVDGGASAGGTDLFGTANGGISLFTAGQKMWTGFQKGLDSLYASGGMGNSFLGTVNYGDFGNTFTPSAFTYGGAIAGGLYAGYNRYQQGGALGGLAGGITYGVGTAYAGIGTAAALSGGMSAGLAAIPVVGWIALAAMLVDMFSGGKLFGTDANKLVGGGSTMSIGPQGADVSSHYTLKGQHALFGGSYYEEHSYVDQAAVDAANQFYQALKTGAENFAKQFGVAAGEVAAGTFAQTFDKHGNVTGSTTTIAGHTYSGESVDQFQTREIAETMINTLSQLDSRLSASIDQYRANADQLLAVTQALAVGAAMMHNGEQFLALGSDQSLTHLLELAQGMQQFGETIDQTLQRIEQAQAQYDQFVGQFKKPVNYVDDFEATLAGINDQMQANIKTANALAQAAGAEGASEQDLANIHATAAQQMADAIRALEQSAQSLAFSMGLTNVGTLDEVNAEIQRLQAKANGGAGAIHDFGNAMQAAAQRATDAMNLLLGDLSPLNDQQKIEKARQGLMAGTVTVDQFLQIARRLYASSQKYVDEFNFAQQFVGAGASGSQYTSGTSGGAAGGGLTEAERKRLSDLLQQQQQLQAQQDYTNAQTLAQQISEIAMAKGKDWRQVVSDMHLDLAGLEKRLGMSDADFAKYMTTIESKQDSEGKNTQTIVDAIYDIGDDIVRTLGGTPSGHSNHDDPSRTGGSSSMQRGHSGHGNPRGNPGGMNADDMREFGKAVGREVGNSIARVLPRNLRSVPTRS